MGYRGDKGGQGGSSPGGGGVSREPRPRGSPRDSKSLKIRHIKKEASLHLKIKFLFYYYGENVPPFFFLSLSLFFFFFAVIFHSVIQAVNE